MSWEYFLGVITYLSHHLSDSMSLDDYIVNNFKQLIVIFSLGDGEIIFGGFTNGGLGYTMNIMDIGISFPEQLPFITRNL